MTPSRVKERLMSEEKQFEPITSQEEFDEGRQERILRHIDLEAVDPANRSTVYQALGGVPQDMPELLVERIVGTGSGGSSKPVLQPEKSLTREEVESMSPKSPSTRYAPRPATPRIPSGGIVYSSRRGRRSR
jgi:hypothetical protein